MSIPFVLENHARTNGRGAGRVELVMQWQVLQSSCFVRLLYMTANWDAHLPLTLANQPWHSLH